MFGRKRKSPFTEDSADPEALYQQGKQLRRSHRTWAEAEQVLARAGDLGHKVAMFDLGGLLRQQHRDDEARAWFVRAQEAGHLLADRSIAAIDEDRAKEQHRRDELAPLLARAEAGDVEAMFDYAWKLRAHFPLEDSDSWFQRAAEAGHRPAFREIAEMARRRNDMARAEEMLRLDAEHGDLEGLRGLSDLLREIDPEQSVPLLERQHELGDVGAAAWLAGVHRRAGRPAEAERWYRLAMEQPGDPGDDAAAALGCLLVEQGRGDDPETETLLRRSIDGDLHLAWLLESRGDDEAAEQLYATLVEQDDDQTEAKAGLARVLARRGDQDNADHFRDEAVRAGESLELPAFVSGSEFTRRSPGATGSGSSSEPD